MRSVDLSEEIRIEPAQKEREIDWPLAPPSETDLPAGIYVAAYINYIRGKWFGQEKIKLLFEIVEPRQFADIVVPLWATMGKGISASWKYYSLWAKASGGAPQRKSRMSPIVFRGYWHVHIAWSKPRKGGHAIPEVIELLDRAAGAPKPCK